MTATVGKPKYVRLADQLRERIRSGDLNVGDRLPSYAEMYREFGATTATVQRVCHLLEQEKLIERRSGSGVYVAGQEPHLTGNLGILGKVDFRINPELFYSHLTHGVQEAARRHERCLVWLDIDTAERSIKQVDGLLLSGHPAEVNREIVRLKPPLMPCVSMFSIAEGMSSVVVDDYGAAKLATQHLLQLGHRRIACLMMNVSRDPQILRNRYAGYQDALQEGGAAFDPRWTRRSHFSKAASDEPVAPQQSLLHWSREQMRSWIKEDWQSLGCTAILAQNDHVAIGIMQILQEEKIDVPGQVSVMGFDGTELCDHVTPRLTSVQLPLHQIGTKAVDLLVAQIERGKMEEQVIALPTKLREGDSVAPPARVLVACA